ncbi:MAG: hypothetical protein WCW35_11425 [Bacteroidota bacterium]|jgi:hypothetical protein
MTRRFHHSSVVILLVSLLIAAQGISAQTMPKKTHSHEISADTAKKMIGNLKKDAMQMKVKGGLFFRDVFDKMLSQKGIIGIRYYYAKMDDGTPTIVLVGVDSLGNDMTTATIAEQTYPCPPYCATETLIGK